MRVALSTALFAVPWFVFATVYFGSPVPHTIAAKALGFEASWSQTWPFTLDSWRYFAPFTEFWFARGAPLPDVALKTMVAIVFALFAVGTAVAARRANAALLCAAAVIGFLGYRSATRLNPYYMWYLPPFTALAWVVAGYGVSQIARTLPRLAVPIGLAVAVAYSAPLAFAMPLDRLVQREIEDGVRARTGQALDAVMSERDTAVLEPLGLMGWIAFNKTIYDFPGLGSNVVLAARKAGLARSVAGVVDALRPTYAALRPRELQQLQRDFPATAQ